ncbi:unnamed protein product [Soboliphyme baturini]|uniref:Uncharacterized protein n=1 Tax=Soboliphyme baturini TaxID=241478 RepID=A0A183ILQ2_9BILA|nr:unnamed protein product [Soboliphyme baturini]
MPPGVQAPCVVVACSCDTQLSSQRRCQAKSEVGEYRSDEATMTVTAGYEKSAIRTCSSPSVSRGRSSIITDDEDRQKDDEDTTQRPSRYPF